MPLAVETGVVFILVVLAALPIGALVFALGAGNAFSRIGKGDFAMDHELQRESSSGASAPVSAEVREEEIRQMVEARSYRRQARGEEALDVDAEVDRLLASERGAGSLGADEGLRDEVRQLKERIHVLERITVEKENSLAREIEDLRNK